MQRRPNFGYFDPIPGDYPIGRDPACSIHLASPDVSRKHAQLTVTPEGCAIEDIGGRYGTLIDNRQIAGKVRVQPGQTITLGRTTLELTPLENNDTTEPSTEQPTQRYEIARQLAKGGMGEVYLALDHQLQRHVALKVMTPEIAANPDLSSRFTQEALVLGRLDHPHIVPIHDLGVDAQGRNYYAMKFVRGTTLKEVLHSYAKVNRLLSTVIRSRACSISLAKPVMRWPMPIPKASSIATSSRPTS